ncbi:MAG: hypothetical protein EBX50_19630 [Chitinophagia bacterium]|nr:hypothetical protein [Chitinophagia bacterium]
MPSPAPAAGAAVLARTSLGRRIMEAVGGWFMKKPIRNTLVVGGTIAVATVGGCEYKAFTDKVDGKVAAIKAGTEKELKAQEAQVQKDALTVQKMADDVNAALARRRALRLGTPPVDPKATVPDTKLLEQVMGAPFTPSSAPSTPSPKLKP